jgi:aminopeptidase N
VTLLGYGFPYDVEIGEAAFEATVESFKLYNQLFGPYPHESLTMIQADFLHGMEYDGLYFLSKAFYNTYDGTPATYLVTIAVHETAHQWWFGLVANDQAMQPWLDEALCTYTELLYYENRHPEALKWWWDYRVEYYEPQGWVDLNIYDGGGYRPYRDAVYLNGMKFLLELRELVGEDVFAAFLKDYVTRSTNQIATADDFFTILREHTDADWSLLKAKYFRNP